MSTYKVMSYNVPRDCDYLSNGKVYEAVPTPMFGIYNIKDDFGEDCNIKIPEVCNHLDLKASWEVLENE